MPALRALGYSLAASLLAPAAAMAQFSESYTFLKAVRDRDGAKVTTAVNKPGSVIVDTRDPASGETALHIVTRGRDTAWVSFMLGRGARPDVRDNQGNTPVMIASQLGYTEGLGLLISRRANVEIANTAGETPLIRAVQNRDIATVRLLLAAGANPAKADTSAGLSARDYALRDVRSSNIVKAMDDIRAPKKAKVGPN